MVLLEEGPGVSKMSLALEQPQTCTGASLGLLQSKRHFRDSRAFTPKDHLLLLLSIEGKFRNFGLAPGSQGLKSRFVLNLKTLPSHPRSLGGLPREFNVNLFLAINSQLALGVK